MSLPPKEVVNFHTLFVTCARFDRERLGRQRSGFDRQGTTTGPKAPLRVRVQCISKTQFLGMAKLICNFRLDNPDGGAAAAVQPNFFKGAGGLWLRLCLCDRRGGGVQHIFDRHHQLF